MKNLIILILLGVSLSGLAEDMETCECKLPVPNIQDLTLIDKYTFSMTFERAFVCVSEGLNKQSKLDEIIALQEEGFISIEKYDCTCEGLQSFFMFYTSKFDTMMTEFFDTCTNNLIKREKETKWTILKI